MLDFSAGGRGVDLLDLSLVWALLRLMTTFLPSKEKRETGEEEDKHNSDHYACNCPGRETSFSATGGYRCWCNCRRSVGFVVDWHQAVGIGVFSVEDRGDGKVGALIIDYDISFLEKGATEYVYSVW
jgi:hypothetical protein